MFNRKKKDTEPEAQRSQHREPIAGEWIPVDATGQSVKEAAKALQRPTVLDLLRQRRAEKMEHVRKLDREIEMLDHDIAFVERYPSSARILEFIASRFNGEDKQPRIAYDRAGPQPY